jgi:hypothetical protein
MCNVVVIAEFLEIPIEVIKNSSKVDIDLVGTYNTFAFSIKQSTIL